MQKKIPWSGYVMYQQQKYIYRNYVVDNPETLNIDRDKIKDVVVLHKSNKDFPDQVKGIEIAILRKIEAVIIISTK